MVGPAIKKNQYNVLVVVVVVVEVVPSNRVIDLLLRNFHVNDQHIEIFDGSQEADSDSCVLNNFFDVRKE